MGYPKSLAALFLVTLSLLFASRVRGHPHCIDDVDNVKVRFALGKYATKEDPVLMSVSLTAIGLPDLNCGTPVDVTVGIANVDVSATPFDISRGRGDFILDSNTLSNDPFTVTFQPNTEISSSHHINLVGDNVYEGPESFYLEIMSISAPKSCAHRIEIDTPSRVQVEIEDNDVLNVNFTNAKINVKEGEKAFITGQTSISPFERPLRIGLICFELDSNSYLQPASEYKDFYTEGPTGQYKLVFDQINVQPPLTSAPVAIQTIDDDIPEDTESFLCTMRLTANPKSPLQAIYPYTVTISILDNDGLFISWEKPFYCVLESDRLALVRLIASNAFKVNFTVSGRAEEVDRCGGHICVNGTRYALANRIDDFTVVDNIPFEFSTAYSSLVSVHTFRLEDDDILEEDEVFQGTFEIPSIISGRLSAMAADPKVTYIIIKDDDNVTVDFVDTNYTCDISEPEGSVNMSIVLKGKHAIPLNVTVECVEEATSDNEESVVIRKVINFPANIKGGMSTSNPRTITIPTDSCISTPEEREYFVCRIVNPSHPHIVTGEQVRVFFTDGDDDGDDDDDDDND